ncbi:MAG: sugar ABC transporter substrate-binding protein [Thermobispora bispora]|jgi:simple sugar transport system substrate-binding protein|uniref:sugar ABC transporter substrate-binding protein n=1 Tax=Thermobispora bispora TaxID=2006 RepID=UPI001980E1E0|nr:sugar ABC transporter substrate-binding protein [Thermobispora bispora]MBO2475255.1 sugar ABC transporter substrate-binding protein [Actinomycetales bacterium]MBX6167790.1 sugar ABC transporter substrate-binding protein [Thermobispora bispora]MDI9581620.1 sugar ABC transporter substrate-binding protein [Thermobispora sp.]QSI48239.1 sugar ABC transporter substrate-binding protein [Thermobispora bispora]
MKRKIIAVAAVLLGALTGCSSGNGDQQGAAAQSEGAQAPAAKFAVITHGSAGDAFWDVVKNGAEAAAKQYGVTVNYQSDGDPAKQSQLIDQAVSEKVDGLVVSMANPEALKESIAKAVAANIPVITINSGADKSKEYGAITHVGQSEEVAGQGAGEKLKEAGVTKLICVIHEAGNIGLDQRCNGATQTLGGTVERLQVDVNDLAGVTSKIKAKLQSDSSFNGVLTLNPAVAIAARDAIKELGSSVTLATFDLSGDVVSAIQNGEILFAVDQQQYLQGWLPITFLYLYKQNLNTVGGGLPVHTGPGFVTKENAAQVAQLASGGTR